LTQKVLASLLSTASLAEQATLICQEIECIAPDAMASILRVDQQGALRPLAGQVQGLEGLALDSLCGNADDAVLADTAGATQECLHDTGVAPCAKRFWAAPVRSGDGRVLAMLVIQPQEAAMPSALHRSLIDACVPFCALALEREESRTRIERLTFHDDLTGLPNRRLLQARAGQAIAKAQRDRSPLAVLVVDLDR